VVAHVRSPILLPVQLSDGQQDCVDKLEEALFEAKQGNVHTVGVVVCMKKGYGATIAGTNAAELNLGLDSLKRKILDALEKPLIMKS
jgi:hypothetical protein